jgi:hypothetical protein
MTTETLDTSATAAASPATAAEAPKPHVPASALPEDALVSRLAAAKKTGQHELLTSLGLASEDELKSIVAANKAAQDAAKSEQQKAVEREAALLTQSTRLGVLEQAVKSVWDAESATLTPAQLAAVTSIAGEDTALRVRTLNALRSTWATASAPATAAVAMTTPAAAPAAAANSAPLPTAPAPAGTTSPTDHKARYESLKQRNPVAASRYFNAHERDIYPES